MASEFDRVPAGMVSRIKGMILSPKAEWQAIDGEATTTRALMMGWVLPLAAIGPVAGLIGQLTFGFSFLGIHIHPSIATAISSAVIGVVLATMTITYAGHAVPSLQGLRIALLIAAGVAALAAVIALTLPTGIVGATEDWSPEELELEGDPVRG